MPDEPPADLDIVQLLHAERFHGADAVAELVRRGLPRGLAVEIVAIAEGSGGCCLAVPH